MDARLMPALLLAVACTAPLADRDASRKLNIAPSAERHMPAILEAVDQLNAHAGYEAFTVTAVDSESTIDDEVVVRGVECLDECDDTSPVGRTLRSPDGVVVLLTVGSSATAAAHEFGHAAGLSHVDDERNLMASKEVRGEWMLETWQVEEITAGTISPRP